MKEGEVLSEEVTLFCCGSCCGSIQPMHLFYMFDLLHGWQGVAKGKNLLQAVWNEAGRHLHSHEVL